MNLSDPIYNWKRFWYARGTEIHTEKGGYLTDPDSGWGRRANKHVVPLEAIADKKCLALLGGPGWGKSHTVESAQRTLSPAIQQQGGKLLRFDLGAYGSENRLVSNVFNGDEIISWIQGGYPLHLFLDSLDEGLQQAKTLAGVILEHLRSGKYPIERLYFRIICRTADWYDSFEQGLRQLWGDQAVGIYKLAPLRSVDVIEAANQTEGVTASTFLKEVDKMSIVPFAAKPVTLKMLLKLYASQQGFPKTQREIYEDGCRLLCAEPSRTRREKGFVGNYAPDEFMAVAARIAAIAVFGRRSAIFTEFDSADANEDDVTIRKLYGGIEAANGHEFKVSETTVLETLEKGLFTDRGHGRRVWDHRSYAEFLAAWYLDANGMDLTQMLSLIKHSGDREGKLVPQLHETAAWLAGMSRDVFRAIMDVEPEVLLQSDVATADEADRKALVAALLNLFDKEKLADRYFSLRDHYHKLNHAKLADQLRPYITDKGKSFLAREAAVLIAKACKATAIQTELADAALDQSELEQIRSRAAQAVVAIADDETKKRLRALAWGEAGPDPDKDLEGYGLKALWPLHMTAEELFTILTPHDRGGAYTAYDEFLGSDIVGKLQPSDLPAALRWVERQGARSRMPRKFSKIIDAIMLRAWEHLDQTEVLECFVRASFSRFGHYEDIMGGRDAFDDIFDAPPIRSFEEMVLEAGDKRRQVLEALVDFKLKSDEQKLRLNYYRNPFISNEDLPWIVNQFESAESDEAREVWAALIRAVFDWRKTDQVNLVVSVSENSQRLRRAFSSFFQVIELDSEEARGLKREHENSQRMEEERKNPPLINPPPKERILAYLDEFEAGDLEGWWKLCAFMPLKPNSTTWEDQVQADLTILPGWGTADGETRRRIIIAAEIYAAEHDSEIQQWLANNEYPPSLAGYKALRLLMKEAPAVFASITAETWAKWAPIILEYQVRTDSETEANLALVKTAYEQSPDGLISGLMLLLDNGHHPIDRVESCWDDRLASALSQKLKDESLQAHIFRHILGHLIDHRIGEARRFAESLISSEGQREKTVIAAYILMTHAEDAGWAVVWPAILQNEQFGRDVIEKVIHAERNSKSIGEKLSETQLGELYVWLVEQYPHRDSDYSTGYSMTPLGSPALFRDSLLNQLVARGKSEACAVLEDIMEKLPQLEWLKWKLMEARDLARRNTWAPPSPAEILKLASDKRLRLVRSSDELLNVVEEVLVSLERDLHGETPAVYELWNELKWSMIAKWVNQIVKLQWPEMRDEVFKPSNLQSILGKAEYNKPKYIPKDENSLSNYIKRYMEEKLKDRGVIINREVEISRGERTDIKVEVRVPGARRALAGPFAVIIEVKGSWNKELDYAMRTQLVDRYLKHYSCQHGVYLIGWFYCPHWDDSDYRKKKAEQAGIDIEEMRHRFSDQAAQLSQGKLRIGAVVVDCALQQVRSVEDEE